MDKMDNPSEHPSCHQIKSHNEVVLVLKDKIYIKPKDICIMSEHV